MRLKPIFSALVSVFVLVGSYVEIVAAAPAGEVKEPELPQTGVLSSSIQTNSGKLQQNLPWGGVDQQGNTSAPITSQVLRDGDKWRLKVFNNSDLRYTFTIRLEQLSKESKTLRSDSFSFALPAKGSADRMVSMASDAAGTRVVMAGWKREEKQVAPTAVPEETPQAATS